MPTPRRTPGRRRAALLLVAIAPIWMVTLVNAGRYAGPALHQLSDLSAATHGQKSEDGAAPWLAIGALASFVAAILLAGIAAAYWRYHREREGSG